MRCSILLLGLISLICGCSVLNLNFRSASSGPRERLTEDYIEHFSYIAQDFLILNKDKLVKLSESETAYLTAIYQKINKSNEILLKSELKPEFYIIDSKIPFYFSMPKAKFFISKILLTKYLRTEELLTVIIGQESIRSHLNLYRRKMLVPTGNISLELMLSLVKIPSEIREELNKWTFSALRRSDEDPYALLNLVQIQNKYQMDFLPQFDTVSDIIKQERMLKNYIASERLVLRDLTPRKISPMYYALIKRIQ